MAATEVVRARVDGRLKEEATAILATMGLTVSDFVRIGLTRVVSEQGLPFAMRAPNRLTAETLAINVYLRILTVLTRRAKSRNEGPDDT